MSTTETLCAMIRERASVGLKKYGVTVDRKDLTADQWIQHAIEEMLDGAAYLMRLREQMSSNEKAVCDFIKMMNLGLRIETNSKKEILRQNKRICAENERLKSKLAAKIQKRRNNERNNQNRKP